MIELRLAGEPRAARETIVAHRQNLHCFTLSVNAHDRGGLVPGTAWATPAHAACFRVGVFLRGTRIALPGGDGLLDCLPTEIPTLAPKSVALAG